MTALTPLVTQAIQVSSPPDSERIVALGPVLGVQVCVHRAPHCLGAREPVASTQRGQPGDLLVGQVDDRSHDI